MLCFEGASSSCRVANLKLPNVFNDTRKVKVLSLPETIKENRRLDSLLTPDEGPSLETSIFPLSFQVVRERLPFIYADPILFIAIQPLRLFLHCHIKFVFLLVLHTLERRTQNVATEYDR